MEIQAEAGGMETDPRRGDRQNRAGVGPDIIAAVINEKPMS